MKDIRIFGLNASQGFANLVCDYLDVPLSPHFEKYFPDREPYIKADTNVRGCDVFVICSLYTDENESVCDKLVKLLIFVGSLRDASAKSINLIIPYLCFMRQDRKVEPRAPITTKYLSIIIESMQIDRILCMDVHSLSVFQSSLRIKTDHLEAKNLIADFIIGELKGCKEDIAVLAPDSGGASRADRFRKTLTTKLEKKIDLVHLDKIREGSVVHGTTISNDVSGKLVVVIDDMISSGSTLAKCAETVEKAGGVLWAACATHGLFVGDVNSNLAKLKRIIITDTVNKEIKLSSEIKEKLTVLSTARLFSRAIRRIYDQGGSISDLLR